VLSWGELGDGEPARDLRLRSEIISASSGDKISFGFYCIWSTLRHVYTNGTGTYYHIGV
jgi:hypothetical protein